MSRTSRKEPPKGSEPKTKGKGRSRKSSGGSPDRDEAPYLEDGPFCDVIINVDGKKFYSNSGVLAFNSPVFMKSLSDDKSKDSGDAKGAKGGGKPSSSSAGGVRELDWSHLDYNDAREMIEFIDPRVDADLTDEGAMRLLPLADEYAIIQMKKACLSTLKNSFIQLRRGRRPGCIATDTAIQYLKLADKYDTEKKDDSKKKEKTFKELCIEEVLANGSPFVGKIVAESDGLSEEVRIKVLERKLDQANIALARERRTRTEENEMRKSHQWKK
ncbi:hypothetical protein ACF0H5_009702 [Mactra antiquata]